MEPTKGAARAFKAAIFIFPDITLDQTSECIDGVQEICKPFYVRQGLMLGEFHLRNNSSGLRNKFFYPLRTPVRDFLLISYFFQCCFYRCFMKESILRCSLIFFYVSSFKRCHV